MLIVAVCALPFHGGWYVHEIGEWKRDHELSGVKGDRWIDGDGRGTEEQTQESQIGVEVEPQAQT